MGAASCGATSTQVLARRRGRDSPQSEIHHLLRESILDRDTKYTLPCDGGGESMPWVEDLGLFYLGHAARNTDVRRKDQQRKSSSLYIRPTD